MQAWEYGLQFLAGGLLIVGGWSRTLEGVALSLVAAGMSIVMIPVARVLAFWRKQEAEAKAVLKVIRGPTKNDS